MRLIKNKINHFPVILSAIFAVRLFISRLPAMAIDHGCWRAWSDRLAALGPAQFYSSEVFTANPPGWLYIFWLLGEIKNKFLPAWSFYSSGYDWLLKLPNNLMDMATGGLIYLIVKKKLNQRWGQFAWLMYVINPAVWFNSAVFGQFDGSGAFFSLLAAYFLLEQKNLSRASLAFAIAWAVKPQAIALAPALGLMALKLFKPREWLKAGLVFVVASLLIYWPFFPANPIIGIIYVFGEMAGLYDCTTCFTFNFWGLWGNWRPDAGFFGWGVLLFSLALGAIFYFKKTNAYWQIALTVLSFNMLMTRMHERYSLPFLAFSLLAAMVLRSKPLWGFYVFFSLFNLINVYYPYAYYNPQFNLPQSLTDFLGRYFIIFSIIGVLYFGSYLSYYVKTHR